MPQIFAFLVFTIRLDTLAGMEYERYIQASDGTSLYTTVCGQGTPLVLCDGLGCAGFIWKYLKEALCPQYQIISWHYRGHGLSDLPAQPQSMNIETMCSDLAAVLDAYQIPSAVLLGHSMGVQVILEFALRYRRRVQALAAICGSYGRPLDTLHGHGHIGKIFPVAKSIALRFPKAGQQLWKHTLRSRPAYAFASRFEVNGDVVRLADFKPYFDHLSGMNMEIFLNLVEHVQGHSVEDHLPEIETPTLIIAGERDTFTPAWLSQRMKQLLPHAELMVVPGGTHIAPIELPELVSLRIERFLAKQLLSQRQTQQVSS